MIMRSSDHIKVPQKCTKNRVRRPVLFVVLAYILVVGVLLAMAGLMVAVGVSPDPIDIGLPP